ncbi:RagB/SusD family nutrient uptake outer membrane protein [Flagellimonas sp.]|uniref:RagB/SusD family nutrient uptake outer membrane protein n=1 Tax=Flagellimonas sp. TaxID=2058762 RepID=UPI003B508082
MKKDKNNLMSRYVKLQSLVVLFGITCVFFSCTKDILDKTPLDAISEADVYGDVNLLSAFVASTYNNVRHIHQGGDRVGTEALGDLTYFSRGDQAGVGVYQDARVEASTGEDVTLDLWLKSYRGIRTVNLFLEGIENSPLTQEELDPLAAQMRFIRAYLYLDLLQWYGGIPIIEKSFSLEDESFDVARNSVEEVVAFISAEADAMLPSLPEVAPGSRASKAGAMALKAKAMLIAASPLFNPSNDMSKWQAASSANEAVMNLSTYQMSDDYASIFNDGNLEAEIIFAREYNEDLHQGGWSGANVLLWSIGFGGWSNVQPNNKYISFFERQTDGVRPLLYDENTQAISINPAAAGFDPKDPYLDLDPRFGAQFNYNQSNYKERTMEYWVEYATDGTGAPDGRDIVARGTDDDGNGDATQTGYNIIKLTDPSVGRLQDNFNASSFSPDIKFRKTEFYLNYAECQLALGNEENARNAINAVRARASVNMPAIPGTVSGTDLVEAYRRERAIEMFMEDQRFFDIRRWKIAEDVMGKPIFGTHIEKLSDGTFMYDYTRVPNNTGARAWNDKLYFLPIPLDEITRSNGTLTQNPGY